MLNSLLPNFQIFDYHNSIKKLLALLNHKKKSEYIFKNNFYIEKLVKKMRQYRNLCISYGKKLSLS